MDHKANGANGDRVEIVPPAKARRYKRPLSTLGGLISETARIYRKMKTGKLDHEIRAEQRQKVGPGPRLGRKRTGADRP